MDSTIVELLNNMGLGTFILLIMALYSFVAFMHSQIKKLLTRYKEKITGEIQEEINMKTLNSDLKNVLTAVENLSTEIDSLKTEFNSFSESSTKDRRYLNKKITELSDRQEELDSTLTKLKKSDLTDIKSFIVSEYHKWMREGYIDVYSLSVIEDQYAIYTSLDGNTFVEDLMNQLRLLQAKTIITDENGVDPIKYFEAHPDHHPKFMVGYNPDDQK